VALGTVISPGAQDVEGASAGAPVAHLLLLIACLPILGMLVIAPVLPDIQRHFATTAGAAYLAPLVLTAPSLSIVLLSPLSGRLASSVGRKRLILIALLLYTLAATAPLYLNDMYAILATRLVVGIAEATLMTVSTMLIGDYFSGSRRDRYLSMQVIYTSVSAVIFLIGGGILGQAGWRVPFATYFIPLLLLPFALTLLREPPAPVQIETGSAAISWRIILPICVVTFLAGGCMNIASVELSYVMEAVGATSSAMKGLGAAVNSAGIAIGGAIMAHRGNATRPLQLAKAFAVGAAGFGIIFAASSLTGVMTGAWAVGLSSGFYLGWLLANLNRHLTFETRGRSVGVWMSSYFFATVLAPVFVVAISTPFGGIKPAMIALAVILAILAIIAPRMLARQAAS
jgi:MFS family permease